LKQLKEGNKFHPQKEKKKKEEEEKCKEERGS
jgi:hypothetical protein